MGLFGKRKYIIQHPERFKAEEKEIIALLKTAPRSSKTMGDTHATVSVPLLGYIDVDTDRMVEDCCTVCWDISESEWKSGRRKRRLKAESCYRLKVRENVVYTDIWKREIPEGKMLFVTEVAKGRCDDLRLEAVLENYRRPRSITLPGGETLTFVRDNDCYEGTIRWMNDTCTLVLGCDEEFACAGGALKAFEQLNADQTEWDRRAREYAAKEMVGLANDWQNDDSRKITRAEVARRIGTPGINVFSDGSVEFVYDDDDMFLGHWIVVGGSVEKGFEYANIEG